MYSTIYGNLHRQFKALELLNQLLEEEFELLLHRDVDAISNQEFAIHELLRQIASERVYLRKQLQGTLLIEYATMLAENESNKISQLYHLIDALEQHCAKNASRNAELSLALMDQSQALLTFLHNQLTPRTPHVYGSQGQVKDARPAAALVSGRL